MRPCPRSSRHVQLYTDDAPKGISTTVVTDLIRTRHPSGSRCSPTPGVTGETPGAYRAPENRWFPAVSRITADRISWFTRVRVASLVAGSRPGRISKNSCHAAAERRVHSDFWFRHPVFRLAPPRQGVTRTTAGRRRQPDRASRNRPPAPACEPVPWWRARHSSGHACAGRTGARPGGGG